MKINKLKKLKDNKYKIYLDNECIITYDTVILENNLLYKKELSSDLYNKIVIDTQYYEVYDKIFNYCIKRRRSEKEVRKYIAKYYPDLDISSIDKIITKLREINLINDLEYSRAFINDKVYLSKNGINKIRIDLLQQDIPIEIVEKELSNIDQNVINLRLEKLVKKKIASNKKYSNNNIRNKILSEMINLGYSKDTIQDLIEQNLKSEDEILKDLFNKNYRLLSRKYDGEELSNKLRSKLLSKGFALGKINKLIDQTKKNL